MVPSDTADKATIIAALKASFDLCDKAYGALTNETNVTEMIALAYGGTEKRAAHFGFAWGNVSHDNEQYAELVDASVAGRGLCPLRLRNRTKSYEWANSMPCPRTRMGRRRPTTIAAAHPGRLASYDESRPGCLFGHQGVGPHQAGVPTEGCGDG